MTPEERQLIESLFDRLRSFGRPEKDKQAEALISQSVRAIPDVPYMLVQSTLIQEQVLEAANTRLQEAEERVRGLEEELQRRPSGSGSFLGGLFGGRGTTDHPPSASPPYGSQSPWSGSPSQQTPATAPPAPGGFMRSAMTTAAGVAGGMLAAGAIRDMLGGSAHANTANTAGTDQARRDHEALARQDAEDDAQFDARDEDARDDAKADAEADAADDRPDSDDTAI